MHNTTGGKYNRGMTVPDTYRILIGKDKLSEEEYKQSSILGWCTELVGFTSFPLESTLFADIVIEIL